MNMKVLLATLAGGVAAFLLGWLIWGILLMEFMTTNTTHYEGLTRVNMDFLLMFISNLAWAFLLSWVYVKTNGKTVMSGVSVGAMLGFFFALTIDLSFLAMMNYITPLAAVVDVIANTIYGAGIGAVIGLILREKTAA